MARRSRTRRRCSIYETGANQWHRYDVWPLACERDAGQKPKPLYLLRRTRVGVRRARGRGAAGSCVRRVRFRSGQAGAVRAASDALQRYADASAGPSGWSTISASPRRAGRTCSCIRREPLSEAVRIAGEPIAHLFASTSGTDSDWVVKLIDVYPDEVPSQPEMGGYQLMISTDIFRGRYRESFERPRRSTPDKPLPYPFALPTANHIFLPGHRIMVQVQSSWFPLYDRNPQTFVPNIFFANPELREGHAARMARAAGGELHRSAGAVKRKANR